MKQYFGQKFLASQSTKGLAWLACLAGMVAINTHAYAASPYAAVMSPENSVEFSFLNGSQPKLRLALAGWGPNWGWVGVGAKDQAKNGKLSGKLPFVASAGAGEVIDIAYQTWKSSPRDVTFRYDLSAQKDVPVTMVICSIGAQGPLAKGKLKLTQADGKTVEMKFPLGRGQQPAATKAELIPAEGAPVAIAFDPPCPIAFDGDIRVMLASEVFKKGTKSYTITLTFPEEVALIADQEGLIALSSKVETAEWFAWKPSNELDGSVIGMENWLETPAGKRGGVRIDGDKFRFEDGSPIKFWGVNLSYGGGCAPEKNDAEFTAARFAKYGVNGVRLHKFSYPKDHMGIGTLDDATKMDPDGLERLDFFASELKKRGVYFGWSHSYNFHVCPGNRDRLVAYDEIEKNLKGDTYAFINFAEDVQDLMIEMVVNLLKHKNPHTGLSYAEEPALSFIEMQNEDDIFFYTSSNAFNACPTYKKLFLKNFAKWLQAKYKTEDNFKKAWEGAIKGDESLAAANIMPETNPWFFGDGNLPNQSGGARQRLLDTAEWLHNTQNKFYAKFEKAIRGAGYKGPLIGSPWQAPSMLPHYYNLRSDWLVGYIDRHNYFGGKLDDSMLAKPGSGYFSSGLQQAIDRPFGLSEWIHVYPSLYSAEGPAILAAYGLGLQGWDASYQFQSQPAARTFDDRVGWFLWGVWEADVPSQIGQYPALSRMVLRGDVKESDVISVRRVNVDDLRDGKFDFADTVSQQGDVKSFGGTVPEESLAAGRVTVEFTKKAEPSTFVDMTRYRKGSVITSSTGELQWDSADKGYFTVNTAGTKAVVGFSQGKTCKLGDVAIHSESPYASIFLTSLEKDASLAKARRALVTAMARNCNSGFTYLTVDQRVLDNGKGPILLEPVRATLEIGGRKIAKVNVLDHDGKQTGKTLSADQGRFTIDSAKEHTIYYEVIFE